MPTFFRSLLTLFLISIFSIISPAQKFNFRNYNINDGLAQPYVYCISQGIYGRLWIGTGDGLSSFDGKKFRNYTTKDGLAENFVTASCKDSKGNIWLGHYEGGLSIYDNTTFKIIDKNIAQSPINVISEDADENIWLGTQNNGLIKITQSKTIEKYPSLFSTCVINAIEKAENNMLLVGTNSGLKVVNATGEKPYLTSTHLDDIAVLKITKIKSNEYLIATNDEGIYQLNIANNKFILTKVISEIDLTGKNLNILQYDRDDFVWIGSFGEGVYKFKNTSQGLIVVAKYTQSSGLANDYIKSLFIDREGDIWMGTFGSGIEILVDPIFTLYTQADGLLNDNVLAVLSEDNNLWVANENGLMKLSFSKHKMNDLSNKKKFPECVGKAKITALLKYKDGDILIGTQENGIWKLNVNTGKCLQWFYANENNLTNKITDLANDKDGNIWVATEDGAFRLDDSVIPSLHLTMESGLLHNNIFSIFVDSKNTVWFATHGTGLSTYQNGKIINFPSPNETSGIDINCFTEDKSGNIWIGTYGQGLFKFDGTKIIKKYNQKNGLGSNYCYLTICDYNNNIWIGHKNGMSKYEIGRNTFTFYQKKEGFLVDEINNNACAKDFENNLWFGSVNGLLRYNLSADKIKNVGPAIGISSLDLFFQKVDWKKFSDTLYSMAQLPLHLQLPYNQNHITFHVRGICFSNPDKVFYKYKLEGFQNEWSLITKEDFVTYPNIPPGQYSFKVIAMNNEGVWSDAPAAFNFTVLNPFWKTWWFTTLMIIAAIILVLLIIKLRTKSLEREQKILQEEKIKLLAEITERKRAERKLKESEDRLKETNQELNTFIYRASHDLRGPLSTVKGLTNLGLMEITDETSLKYFDLIADRVNRLDFILKDLINIVEIAEVAMVTADINMPSMIADIVAAVQTTPLPKPVKFQLNINNKNNFLGDKKVLYNVIYNLIDNAIKYHSNDRNDIFVSVEIEDYKNGILILITDNGIGIPKEIQGRIFDMFFRGTDQSKGSGLGLYLVKKIVTRLHGKIKVNSTPKNGTQIELYLPSGLADASDDSNEDIEETTSNVQ